MNFRSGNVHTFTLSLGTQDTIKGSSNYTINSQTKSNLDCSNLSSLKCSNVKIKKLNFVTLIPSKICKAHRYYILAKLLEVHKSSNGNASETKAKESFNNGVFFDIEAKRTPSIVSRLFSKRSEHIR